MAVSALTLLACWLIMRIAPSTPIARWLHDVLVERPAARLSSITRGDVVVGIALVLTAGMVAFVGETDGLRMATMMLPDAAVWLTTFEVSAYVEILTALALAASMPRMRAAIVRLAPPIGIGFIRRAGRRTPCRHDASAPTANDEDHRGIGHWLAARSAGCFVTA